VNSKFKRIAATVLILPLMFVTACGVSAEESVKKVHVGAGPFEDPKFKDCIDPGTKSNAPTNDNYFAYPVSDRDYDATGQEGSDSAAFTVVSKDNVPMSVPVTIRFNMIADCDTLKDFHKAHGSRYSAYLADDGTSTKGWLTMLRKLMADPADSQLDEIAKKYNWLDLYNNAEVQNELQQTLADNISDIVSTQAKGEYFDNYIVLVKKPSPTDDALLSTITTAQKDLAAATAKIRQAEADEATAKAQIEVSKAEAAKQKAIIDGYGGYENYAKSQAIEKGLNPFQPTYIVPGTKP